MSAFRISFSRSAVGDLEAIRAWYAGQGAPQVGTALVAEIFERIEVLGDHPDIGRVVPEFGQTFLRELIQPPFRIVYRHDADRVRIVRVWRSERPLRIPRSEML